MPFQFNHRYVLLTYAQCGPIDPFEIVNTLSSIGAECIIGREYHADGNIHLHAFVDFGRKYRGRNERFADVAGCHPNIQPVGHTPEKSYDYAIKDGDVVAGGLVRPERKEVLESSSKWNEIMLAETRDEFLELAQRMAPRDFATSFHSIRSCAEWKYPNLSDRYCTPTGISFDLSGYPELTSWVQANLFGVRGKAHR